MARFDAAATFARAATVGGVVGRSGVPLPEPALATLVDQVSADLQAYVGPDGLAFPMGAHLVSAIR